MGNFFGSTQIRTASMDKVKDVVKTLCQKEEFECYLSPRINGWVGIYNNMNGQVPLGETLAEHFQEDIISLLVHDDDVFCYWYYKDGKLVDQYNSCPDYFGEDSDDESRGNPKVFQGLVNEKKDIQRMEEILNATEQESSQEQNNIPGLPGKASDGIQKMMKLSKMLQDMEKNPGLMEEIANQLNIPLKEKAAELFGDLSGDEKDKGALFNAAMQNQKQLNELFSPIFEAYIEQGEKNPKKGENKAEEKTNKKAKSNSARPRYIFAGEQLRDFAEVLNIKNTLTCYEYLQQGETDDIVDWEKFVKLP